MPQARTLKLSRQGFTLVEMLVVIVIITALAALIIPAVMIAIRTAKQARITLEVGNLAKAVERYKAEFGEYPPDFSWSAIGANEQERASRAKQLIDEHLAAIFRRRSTTLDYPLIGPTTVAAKQLAQLSPKNALVFWLQGFTADPQAPLSGSGERNPLFDFDKGRFRNLEFFRTASSPDSNVAPGLVWGFRNGSPDKYSFADEYYSVGDSEKQPYIYFNSASYNKASQLTPGNPTTAAAVVWANANGVMPPYISSTLSNANEVVFAEPEKFQIISAGLDSAYGGLPASVNRDDITVYPRVPSGDNITRDHRDNITSFSEGSIKDMVGE